MMHYIVFISRYLIEEDCYETEVIYLIDNLFPEIAFIFFFDLIVNLLWLTINLQLTLNVILSERLHNTGSTCYLPKVGKMHAVK